MKAQNIKRFDILESNGTPKKKILILETIHKKSDFISNNLVYIFYIEFKTLNWRDIVLLRQIPEDAEIDFHRLEDPNIELELCCNIGDKSISKEKDVPFDEKNWKNFFEKHTSPEGFFLGGYVSFRKDVNYIRADVDGLKKVFDFVSKISTNSFRYGYYKLFGVKTSVMIDPWGKKIFFVKNGELKEIKMKNEGKMSRKFVPTFLMNDEHKLIYLKIFNQKIEEHLKS